MRVSTYHYVWDNLNSNPVNSHFPLSPPRFIWKRSVSFHILFVCFWMNCRVFSFFIIALNTELPVICVKGKLLYTAVWCGGKRWMKRNFCKERQKTNGVLLTSFSFVLFRFFLIKHRCSIIKDFSYCLKTLKLWSCSLFFSCCRCC